MTTVLITGASRGMGAHTARHLAERGWVVFAGARDATALAERGWVVFAGARDATALAENLATDPATAGLDIRPVAIDVTDDRSVDRAARLVGDTVSSIDVLINNAAIPGTWEHPAHVGPEDLQAVMDTNLLGPVRVTRAFLSLLRQGTDPRLVMVSSGMGSLAMQSRDEVYADITHLPYPASKAALNMLTVQYAKALPDVVVTAVDPGLTATEFTDGVGQGIDQGAEVMISAALNSEGPSGQFIDRHGPTDW